MLERNSNADTPVWVLLDPRSNQLFFNDLQTGTYSDGEPDDK